VVRSVRVSTPAAADGGGRDKEGVPLMAGSRRALGLLALAACLAGANPERNAAEIAALNLVRRPVSSTSMWL
jgi:hypothetical protein